MQETDEIEAKITGRVQMVMYRDFAQRKARGLKLLGFVKNNPDGSVTVVAQGNKETLDKYIELLKEGSMLSKVENVSVIWKKTASCFGDFHIMY
jgi:acylphosphatase